MIFVAKVSQSSSTLISGAFLVSLIGVGGFGCFLAAFWAKITFAAFGSRAIGSELVLIIQIKSF